jgi:hypothetical protein
LCWRWGALELSTLPPHAADIVEDALRGAAAGAGDATSAPMMLLLLKMMRLKCPYTYPLSTPLKSSHGCCQEEEQGGEFSL